MNIGYDRPLYILPFDHRGTFQKNMFGWSGALSAEQTAKIAEMKKVIYDGFKAALAGGVPQDKSGILVDEQFGAEILRDAAKHGYNTSCPAEKSGQEEFDFEYGEDFAKHIEQFRPTFCKVLVRYNPEGDAAMNERQLGRLKTLADWLHANGRKFLFELLVPAEPAQLEAAGGDVDRYDSELRPALMHRAIRNIQDFGIEVDIWKIEGVEEQADAQMLAEQTRSGEGRENVVCVLLGRGASDAKVDQWLREAAPVEGFVGFAIGRSIWWDALRGFLDGSVARADAASQIADNYLRFIRVYEQQAVA